jgi:hypothetical protein
MDKRIIGVVLAIVGGLMVWMNAEMMISAFTIPFKSMNGVTIASRVFIAIMAWILVGGLAFNTVTDAIGNGWKKILMPIGITIHSVEVGWLGHVRAPHQSFRMERLLDVPGCTLRA